MDTSTPFKWRYFQADIILLCVRWYLRYPTRLPGSGGDDARARIDVDHTTIYRSRAILRTRTGEALPPHLNATNDSWRVDETYVKVKKAWMYLYRAVDSQGNTLEFLLSPRRDAETAKRFFSKALAAPHSSTPRVITVDKNADYPKAFKELKGSCQILVNCGKVGTSTTSSSKITASSNDWSSSGWASFPSRRRGELYRDTKQ